MYADFKNFLNFLRGFEKSLIQDLKTCHSDKNCKVQYSLLKKRTPSTRFKQI